ncbi:MAG: DNA cytosine methyltransferase [Alphaproteobacteria bacterium]|nr:DNA cytosine methyltransferase [Alphaproteobacteria bacterium]
MTHLFPPTTQGSRANEIIVDSFAGGGGASTGIFMALGRHPDVAINHDEQAVAMHTVNHPETEHFCQNVWQVNPSDVAQRGPIGLAWFSPDCKHFSKAKGGKPVEKRVRDLAWIVVAYAKLPAHLRPRVILLENVEEFITWGPLDENDKPCPKRKGDTFLRWVGELKRHGYKVHWRELRACDYGAPTIRKRLFLIARCDGLYPVWPEPTHGKPDSPEVQSGKLKPWRTAADIIDWSIPCPSIFLTKEEARALRIKRPLEEATMRRIFRGLKRYVIDNPRPFIVPVTHQGGDRCHDSAQPLRTITTAKRGEMALVLPHLMTMRNAGKPFNEADKPTHTVTAGGAGLALVEAFITKFRNGSVGHAADEPLHTVTCSHSDHHPGGAAPLAVVMPWMAQHNLGVVGHEASEPVSTITQTGSQQMLAAACLSQFHGTNHGNAGDPTQPLGAILAQGFHHAEVRAFLTKYYGEGGQDQDMDEPLHTATTKARFGLVTVAGVDYQIVDIGMRMLSARELFRAQGFPENYIIDFEYNGRPLPGHAKIRMCGNSVCPPIAAALVRANCSDLAAMPEAAAAE